MLGAPPPHHHHTQCCVDGVSDSITNQPRWKPCMTPHHFCCMLSSFLPYHPTKPCSSFHLYLTLNTLTTLWKTFTKRLEDTSMHASMVECWLSTFLACDATVLLDLVFSIYIYICTYIFFAPFSLFGLWCSSLLWPSCSNISCYSTVWANK